MRYILTENNSKASYNNARFFTTAGDARAKMMALIGEAIGKDRYLSLVREYGCEKALLETGGSPVFENGEERLSIGPLEADYTAPNSEYSIHWHITNATEAKPFTGDDEPTRFAVLMDNGLLIDIFCSDPSVSVEVLDFQDNENKKRARALFQGKVEGMYRVSDRRKEEK